MNDNNSGRFVECKRKRQIQNPENVEIQRLNKIEIKHLRLRKEYV